MKEIILKNTFPKGEYSKEENKKWFIIMLRRSIMEAVKVWDKKHKPAFIVKQVENFTHYVQLRKEKLTKEAETKYKTQNKREEYINTYLAEYISKWTPGLAQNKGYQEISFFDFDVEPGTNYIHGTCVLDINDLSDKKLEACWNDIKDNEYFKEAEGLQFEYDGIGRPQITLRLSRQMQKQFDQAKENLGKTIANFYSGSNYWGD